jgi:transcriptional regulator with XRE-family HTH domain
VTIGRRVRQLREERGLTGKELAELAGIDGSQVTRLETGQRTPDASALLRVARALETSLEWLLTGERGAIAALARETAAAIAHEGGVSYDAVRAVVTRPLRPEDRALPALYWIDEMRAEEVRLRTVKQAAASPR